VRGAAPFPEQVVQLISVAACLLELAQSRIAGSGRTGHPGEHLQERWRRLFLVLFSARLRLMHRGDEILNCLFDSLAVPILLSRRRDGCPRYIGAAWRSPGDRARGELLPGAIGQT
jgi:hypothetical protein